MRLMLQPIIKSVVVEGQVYYKLIVPNTGEVLWHNLPNPFHNATIESLIYYVLDRFKIDKLLLFNKSLKRKATLPRQVLQYLMYNKLHMTEQEIADYFDVTHATINHNRRLVDNLISINQFEL